MALRYNIIRKVFFTGSTKFNPNTIFVRANELSVKENKKLISTSQVVNEKLYHNIQEIEASEKAKFSPKRSRDVSSSQFDVELQNDEVEKDHTKLSSSDSHSGKYDLNQTVSLSSVMDSNVPSPYNTNDIPPGTYSGMGTAEFGKGDKFISNDLQTNHHSRIKKNSGIFQLRHSENIVSSMRSVYNSFASNRYLHTSPHYLCQVQLTPREKLKRAVKEYGATVFVLHISIALVSLGTFYFLISCGIDMEKIFRNLGINLSRLDKSHPEEESNAKFSETELEDIKNPTEDNSKDRALAVAAGTTTFVIAYAVHKSTAPFRIALTLAVAPFVVRHLRRIGFLKTPKKL